MKMRKVIMTIISVFVIFLLGYGLFSWVNAPGEYDEFAKCLTENGAVMYGTDWCTYCKKEKDLFGNSFKYINFNNCDQNRGECTINGVESYPTWIINGEKYIGLRQLEELSELTGCEIR